MIYPVRLIVLASLHLTLCLGAVQAQSYSDAQGALERIAAAVDRAHGLAAPAGGNTLSRLRDGWRSFRHAAPACLKPVQVNGAPVEFGVIGPFERQDGLDFLILSRGFAAAWDGGNRAASLMLSQRFDARSGEPEGALFLEGSYFPDRRAVAENTVAADRWVDVPRARSSPPIHREWGIYLSALVRAVDRDCDRLTGTGD